LLVFYCNYVSVCLVPFLRYTASNNGVTLKSSLEVTQCRKLGYGFLFALRSNYGRKFENWHESYEIWLPSLLRRLSSVFRRPSRSYISKTKQDRPILLLNTRPIRNLASLILLLRSDQTLRHSDASGFKYKICANIYTASCTTWRQTTPVVNRARQLL